MKPIEQQLHLPIEKLKRAIIQNHVISPQDFLVLRKLFAIARLNFVGTESSILQPIDS